MPRSPPRASLEMPLVPSLPSADTFPMGSPSLAGPSGGQQVIQASLPAVLILPLLSALPASRACAPMCLFCWTLASARGCFLLSELWLLVLGSEAQIRRPLCLQFALDGVIERWSSPVLSAYGFVFGSCGHWTVHIIFRDWATMIYR